MRYLVAGTLLCLAAASAQASTIVSQRLTLRTSVDGVVQTSLNKSTTSLSELDVLDFTAGGWTGSAELVATGAPGATFASPYEIDLTHVSLVCGADPGQTCSALMFSFNDNVILSTGSDFANQPYSISLTGSGPAATLSLSANSSSKPIFPAVSNQTVAGGDYSFSSSGLIGNISAANLSGTVNFLIAGSFGVASGNPGDTISLPDSFALTLGAAPVTATPEPATWALAGGFLLIGIGAIGRLRRRAA